MGRLAGKIAVVVGAGQTPGATLGNGRATALRFAEEGATVLMVDRNGASAEETLALARERGGEGSVCEADITREAEDRIFDTNLKGIMLVCKHALPPMREQGSGVITNISSVAAVCAVGIVAYKSSKAALNAYTHSLATGNARHGIRANVIMPGLMNTPMAIEGYVAAGHDREALISSRDAQVPLGGRMGDAWDVANAALFLASDEARFITGVCLPVDGGQSARIG